jgi:hypothetical protein
VAPRKGVQTEPGRTAWGTLDWSHAPLAREGYWGVCSICGELAVLKHPIRQVPCHKVCDDAQEAAGRG